MLKQVVWKNQTMPCHACHALPCCQLPHHLTSSSAAAVYTGDCNCIYNLPNFVRQNKKYPMYVCHFVLFYILCWWLNDKYMGVYLIYGSPNFWKPHCVCIQVPLQHWCYLFRGASEQLKSWKRGRRLKYFASEMKIFCSGDEKSLIGCNQPRWSSQYSEGQIFIIGYRVAKTCQTCQPVGAIFFSWC